MKNFLFCLLVVIAGGFSTLQGPVNVQLGLNFTHNPILSALFSYSSSWLMLIVLALVLRAPGPTWNFRATKWWHWLGGVVGASYVCSMILTVPVLGVAAVTVIVVLGQLAFGLLLDQYGVMGMTVRKVSAQKLFGTALVLCGTLMVFIK